MTIQEKKNYLMQYRKIINNILSLEKQIKEIAISRYSLSGIDYSKDKVQTTPKDSMAEAFIKQDELESKLHRKLHERAARLEDIVNCLDSMDDSEEQLILTYRYIEGYSWEEICCMMHRSRRSVLYIYGSALKHFAVKNN